MITKKDIKITKKESVNEFNVYFVDDQIICLSNLDNTKITWRYVPLTQIFSANPKAFKISLYDLIVDDFIHNDISLVSIETLQERLFEFWNKCQEFYEHDKLTLENFMLNDLNWSIFKKRLKLVGQRNDLYLLFSYKTMSKRLEYILNLSDENLKLLLKIFDYTDDEIEIVFNKIKQFSPVNIITFLQEANEDIHSLKLTDDLYNKMKFL